tara:strand:- start:706 stop:1125 length:420 start_codon:yes stop_codon:yes gene_type:complete
MKAMQSRIVGFRGEDDPEDLKELKNVRYNVFANIVWLRFGAVCVYAAYLYGILKLPDQTITGLNILLAFATVLLRVVVQRQTSVFHRDMNFYMTFLGLYGGSAMYFAFAVPGFEAGAANYISAAIGPLTSLVSWAFISS